MHRLGKGNQNGRNSELFVGEVFHNISVQSENTKLVRPHDAGQQLHD